MKMFHNQMGVGYAVFPLTAFVFLLNFPLTATAKSAPPDVIVLTSGVTGGEIQDALNSLPASGGEVVLPPGIYEISQPIVMQRSFQTLRGAGETTVLRLADNANCPVLILGEPVNSPKQTVKE